MVSRLILEVGLLCAASFFQGTGFSLIAPFYPKEAAERNNSPTHVGIVMGVYQLLMFLTSPYFGWAISQRTFKSRTLLWSGLMVDGISSALFGLVIFIKNPILFFMTSLLLRIIQALGNSASMTCYFTLLGAEFPHIVGSLIPFIETAFSVGLIVGPFLGGISNDMFGFTITFMIFGGLLASLGVICALVFPTPPPALPNNLSLLKTLKNRRVATNTLLFAVALMCIGFNDATLASHLKSAFEFSPSFIGLMFIPCGLAQAICSPLWGSAAGKISITRLLCVIGAAFCGTSFFMNTPFFLLDYSLGITILAQIFLGIGVGAIYIPAFIDTLNHCFETLKYPDEVPTYALLSGILTASLCFGSAVGASAGGALLDVIGYDWACQVMVGILGLTLVLLLASLSRQALTKETTPLV